MLTCPQPAVGRDGGAKQADGGVTGELQQDGGGAAGGAQDDGRSNWAVAQAYHQVRPEGVHRQGSHHLRPRLLLWSRPVYPQEATFPLLRPHRGRTRHHCVKPLFIIIFQVIFYLFGLSGNFFSSISSFWGAEQ